MRSKRLRTIYKEVSNYVKFNHKRINVLPEQGMFNYRCFYNAVEFARKHPDTVVVEVMFIDDGEPILHYINQNKDTGEYIETTLGFRASSLDYYFIRVIDEKDYSTLGSQFSEVVNSWTMRFTSWFDRKILSIDRVV